MLIGKITDDKLDVVQSTYLDVSAKLLAATTTQLPYISHFAYKLYHKNES